MELPCKAVSSMDFFFFFRFVELHAVLFKVKRGIKENAKKYFYYRWRERITEHFFLIILRFHSFIFKCYGLKLSRCWCWCGEHMERLWQQSWLWLWQSNVGGQCCGPPFKTTKEDHVEENEESVSLYLQAPATEISVSTAAADWRLFCLGKMFLFHWSVVFGRSSVWRHSALCCSSH